MLRNKRSLYNDSPTSLYDASHKRYKRYTNQNDTRFESQDIVENIERLRIKRKDSELTIKHGLLLMTFPNSSLLQDCIAICRKYISSTKLLTDNLQYHNLICIILKDFNLLDVTMFLAVLCSLNDKYWYQNDDTFSMKISKNTKLNGSFFITKNCFRPKQNKIPYNSHNFSIEESSINKLAKFKEININSRCDRSLTFFITGIADFLSSIKFGKHSNDIVKQFRIELNGYYKSLASSLLSLPIPPTSLIDCSLLKEKNSPITSYSKKILSDFVKGPIPQEKAKIQRSETSAALPNGVNKSITTKNVKQNANENWENKIASRNASANVTQQKFNRQLTTNTGIHNNNIITQRNGYLSPLEIKQHCIATINSTIDFVKSRKPGEILKTYVRCPKQNCIDKIFQNLDQLRTQTNCNIVVLNLNNIHESDPWFKDLDLSKYTKISVPPPSTIRVISVGGMNEYIIRALTLITNIISSS